MWPTSFTLGSNMYLFTYAHLGEKEVRIANKNWPVSWVYILGHTFYTIYFIFTEAAPIQFLLLWKCMLSKIFLALEMTLKSCPIYSYALMEQFDIYILLCFWSRPRFPNLYALLFFMSFINLMTSMKTVRDCKCLSSIHILKGYRCAIGPNYLTSVG